MLENQNQDKTNKEFNFFDYIIILLRWHKILIAVFLLSSSASVVTALLITPKFTATTTIMAPQTPNLIQMLGGGQGALQRLASGSLFGRTSNMGGYNYFAILNSRSLREAVINEFNLAEHYNLRDAEWERVNERLNERLSLGTDRNDYFIISVEDEDPERATAMSIFIVEELNRRSIEMAQREASANREFMEVRVEETRERLLKAENELLEHFQTTNILAVPDQNLSTLGAFTELYTQRVSKEIELAFLENSFQPDDRLVRQVRFELNEIEKRIADIPEASVESLRRYRELVITQRLLEFLTPLLEQARIEEQRNVPVLLILDEARLPEKRSSPRRSLIVLITVFLSMGVTVVSIFIFERISRLMAINPQYKAKVYELEQEFRNTFSRK